MHVTVTQTINMTMIEFETSTDKIIPLYDEW